MSEADMFHAIKTVT